MAVIVANQRLEGYGVDIEAWLKVALSFMIYCRVKE